MNRHPAVHCSIHLAIEPGHEIDGREPAVVLWTRSTYRDDYAPRAYVAYGDTTGQDIPTDLLPSWVPRPPAAWLAISEELRDAATDRISDDFETHPAGTARRLAELEGLAFARRRTEYTCPVTDEDAAAARRAFTDGCSPWGDAAPSIRARWRRAAEAVRDRLSGREMVAGPSVGAEALGLS